MEWCHLLHTISPLTITTKIYWVHYANSRHHLGENLLVVLTFASKILKELSQGYIRLRPIPSNCKDKYRDFVDPVYETDKVPKEEMECLSCRATHCVRLKVNGPVT